MDKPIVVVDLETTGLSPSRHKITEIGAVKLNNGKVVDKFQTLIDPEVHIPTFITRLTGIDDNMVDGAPTIDKALPKFKRFLGKDIMVAHYATFDYNFLKHNFFEHHNVNLNNSRLCTRKLANRIHPQLPSKRLDALCQFYNIKNEQVHRAMGDVMATVKVFNNMMGVLHKSNIKTAKEIFSFESLPVKKAQELLKR